MALLQAGALPISLVGVLGVNIREKKSQPASMDEPRSQDGDDYDDVDNGDNGDRLMTQDFRPYRSEASAQDARFELEYRQVHFCFDADHLKNRNVRQAEIKSKTPHCGKSFSLRSDLRLWFRWLFRLQAALFRVLPENNVADLFGV